MLIGVPLMSTLEAESNPKPLHVIVVCAQALLMQVSVVHALLSLHSLASLHSTHLPVGSQNPVAHF